MSVLQQQVEQLLMAQRRLDQQWEQLCASWDDEVRRDFQRTFQEPLVQQTLRTAAQMERLAEVVAQAQRRVR